MGPFEILVGVGSIAYQLVLPPHIKIHDVFHVLVLKRYVYGKNHIIVWNLLQVEAEGDVLIELVHIIERTEIVLKKWEIAQVKVQWENYAPKYATCKIEEEIRHLILSYFKEEMLKKFHQGR